MALAGTYEYESQDKYVEYLQSLGLSEEQAKISQNLDAKLVIGPIEADKVTVLFGDIRIVFLLNKEAEYDLSGGNKKKATATLNGDTLNIKTKFVDDGSLIEEKVIKATDSGLVVNVSTNLGAKAVRRYKRV